MKKFSSLVSTVFAVGIFLTNSKAQVSNKKKSGSPYERIEQTNLAQMGLSGRKKGWTFKGTNSLLINQSGFSNWVTGGVNSLTLTARADYDFHLTKNAHLWDSRVLLGYGIRSEEKETAKKSEDIIDLNSIYGYHFKPSWYYAARLNLRTQLSQGYDYDKKPKEKISNFLSPAYLSAGLGLDYRPDDDFTLNLHPLTSRMTFVMDQDVFNSYDKNGSFAGKESAYGIDPSRHFNYELGMFIGARDHRDLMQNLAIDNTVNIFSNYLKKPQNMYLSYMGILVMKINKLLSTQLVFEVIYDENQIKKTQLKETLGVGLTYLLQR